jgi:hypothetical protein
MHILLVIKFDTENCPLLLKLKPEETKFGTVIVHVTGDMYTKKKAEGLSSAYK